METDLSSASEEFGILAQASPCGGKTGKFIFRILLFSSLIVIRATLHTNLTFKASLRRDVKGEAFGPSKTGDVIFFNGKN
jgi:hypothetical protein